MARVERVGSKLAAVRRAILAVAILGMFVVLSPSSLATELRMFDRQSPYSTGGYAPVPQDDAQRPAFDAAIRAIAARLPHTATCVIAVDAWRREYFRASYLLMPRRVWPAGQSPRTAPYTTAQLLEAAEARQASCLLTLPGQPAPAAFRRLRSGMVALYMRPGSAR